jgi:hypothetical protein
MSSPTVKDLATEAAIQSLAPDYEFQLNKSTGEVEKVFPESKKIDNKRWMDSLGDCC